MAHGGKPGVGRYRKRFELMTPVGRVYTVDGPSVRARAIDFVGGSHRKVDHLVPANEIWIERMKGGRTEERYLLAHEMTEITLMTVRGWLYQRAHDVANLIEKKLRAGADPQQTFTRFVTEYFPTAWPDVAKKLADDLSRAYEAY